MEKYKQGKLNFDQEKQELKPVLIKALLPPGITPPGWYTLNYISRISKNKIYMPINEKTKR